MLCGKIYMVILMKNAPLLIFDGCFGNFILNMPFCNDSEYCLYFLEYVLPTRPL